MKRLFFTALRGQAAFEKFQLINKNPANSYRAGYEQYMDFIPIVTDEDEEFEKYGKLASMQNTLLDLAVEINEKSWIWENWPAPGNMLTRTMLALDEESGAQIVLVRWNVIETPIHGHQYGQMIDVLLRGEATEVNYKIVDEQKRLVERVGSHSTCGYSVLSNQYTSAKTLAKGAVIHKFQTFTKAITLHFIPELPPDGKGNLFTEITPQYHDSL